MADNCIRRIDAQARARIARTAQIEALTPTPRTPLAGIWQLNRKNYAHGAFSNYLSARNGGDEPALRAIKEAALAAGVSISDVDMLTMDQVLVTPDLISSTVGGRYITTLLSGAQTRAPKLSEVKYKILDTGSIFTLDLKFDAAPGINTEQRTASRTGQLYGPVYALGLHLSTRENQGLETFIQITCPELGLTWSPSTDSAASITPPNVNLPLGFIIDKPTTWTMYAEALDTLPNAQAFGANLLLSYRHVVRE